MKKLDEENVESMLEFEVSVSILELIENEDDLSHKNL